MADTGTGGDLDRQLESTSFGAVDQVARRCTPSAPEERPETALAVRPKPSSPTTRRTTADRRQTRMSPNSSNHSSPAGCCEPERCSQYGTYRALGITQSQVLDLGTRRGSHRPLGKREHKPEVSWMDRCGPDGWRRCARRPQRRWHSPSVWLAHLRPASSPRLAPVSAARRMQSPAKSLISPAARMTFCTSSSVMTARCARLAYFTGAFVAGLRLIHSHRTACSRAARSTEC